MDARTKVLVSSLPALPLTRCLGDTLHLNCEEGVTVPVLQPFSIISYFPVCPPFAVASIGVRGQVGLLRLEKEG